MRRLFKLNTGRTQIVHLLHGNTINEIIAEARGGWADGADGVAVELSLLDPAERNADSLQWIMDNIPLPFMFIHYRRDTRIPVQPDDERQKLLLAAAEAGAGMIDVMGDLYDPSPDERTRDPQAIARQKELIARIHAAGAQVLISSHPMRVMTAEAVVEQLQDFESRGADVVKIVTMAETEADFLENTRATMLAWRTLKVPFIHLCGGKFSRIQRFNGLALGCAMTFAVHEYHEDMGYNQPTIRQFRTVQDNLTWNVNAMVEK